MGDKMKKNLVIAILCLACFLLMLLSSSLLKDIRLIKSETGRDYYYLVSDTKYLVREIKEVNFREVVQTEHGKKLLTNFNSQLWDKEWIFLETPNRLNEIGIRIREVNKILNNTLKQGTITEKEEAAVKNSLEIIGLIMIDLEVFTGQDITWYELFNDRELSEEINKKIEQRLNEDY